MKTQNPAGVTVSRASIAELAGAIADHVAHYDATLETLITRFVVDEQTARAGLAAARRRRTVRQDEHEDDDSTLFMATDRGFEMAGLKDWPKLRSIKGADAREKALEPHPRAVAAVAAAVEFWIATGGRYTGELWGERYLRQQARINPDDRFEINLSDNLTKIHRPDLAVKPRRARKPALVSEGRVNPTADEFEIDLRESPTEVDRPDSKTPAAEKQSIVIEVVARPRTDEELDRINKGWSTHKHVKEVHFYVTGEFIDQLWRSIRRTDTGDRVVVYRLEDSLKAEPLLDKSPETAPAVISEPPVVEQEEPPIDGEDSYWLKEMLKWIGAWKLVDASAITEYFKFPSKQTSRFLAHAKEYDLVRTRRPKGEDEAFYLTAHGMQVAGTTVDYSDVDRRNEGWHIKRARIVARLTHKHSKLGIYGPDEAREMFRLSMPGIEALVDGQVRPYRADLVLRSQGGKLVGAIVVLHQHLSRRTLDALAEAWSECADVSEVVFYAIPDICEQLEQAIARVHSGVTLKLKTIPLSRSARMRLNAAKGHDLQAKHNLDAEREREEWRKEWTDADPPFEELTDGEWEVLDPILSPGRRKEIHWKGLRLRNDRQIINTLLLASYLGRPLSVMTVFMGYESGVTCRRRLEDWRDAGILGEAWQKLTDMSPHRDLPSSDSLIKRERQVDARGLFNYLDWQEILRADAIVWEGLERARTSGQVSPAT